MCFYRGCWLAGKYHGEGTLFHVSERIKARNLPALAILNVGRGMEKACYTIEKVTVYEGDWDNDDQCGKGFRDTVSGRLLTRAASSLGNILEQERYSIPMASRQSTRVNFKRTRGTGRVSFIRLRASSNLMEHGLLEKRKG